MPTLRFLIVLCFALVFAQPALADPLASHIEVQLPGTVRTVGDAAQFYAAAAGIQFTCATPASGNHAHVCASPAPRPRRAAPPATIAAAIAALAPGYEVRLFTASRVATFALPSPDPVIPEPTQAAQLAVSAVVPIPVPIVLDARPQLPALPVARPQPIPALTMSALDAPLETKVTEPQPSLANADLHNVVLRIPRGGFLSRAVEQFAIEHGLTVRWRAGVDFPVVAPAEFSGPSPQAVIATVIRSTATTRAPLAVVEQAGNLTVSRL